MKLFSNYVRSHKRCELKILAKYYLTQEVKDVLSKYDLTLHELCYRIKYNISLDKIFVCKYCGKPTHFLGMKGYSEACSVKCELVNRNKSQEHKDKRKQTCIRKYGVDNYSKTKECKEKVKFTVQKKYGIDNYAKTKEFQDKYKQVMLDKYGVENYSQTPDYNDKVKKTSLAKYGKEYYTQTQECKDKIKVTCQDKYGVDSYTKTKDFQDKMEQTCFNKYGVKNYVQTEEFKAKAKQTCLDKYGVDSYTKTKECQNKKKQTCLKRFGESNYAKTQKFKEFIKDHINEIQVKSYNTKKKNNSFHTSKDENEVYDLLLTKFTKDDIIRQYKSEVYPFVCDFYIKSLDLYIEYNGTWTHGYDINGKCLGSFDENNLEHIKLLEFWENKSKEVNFKKKVKTYYKNAIYTWTVLDVKKLETFRKNNLNYKIFWNLEEVKNWIEEYN